MTEPFTVENQDLQSPQKTGLHKSVVLVGILVICLLGGFTFFYFRNYLYVPSKPDVQVAVIEQDPVIENSEKTPDNATTALDKDDFLNLELNLLRSGGSPAESQLFGFKFGSFHKDWECLNSGLQYTADGLSVSCVQKDCSLEKELGYPNTFQVGRSQECLDELENREYPQSILSSITVHISPSYVEVNQNVDEENSLIPNKASPKGNNYFFEVINSDNARETGWLKQYKIIFYSPKEISDVLSKYTGTMFGSEKIYAKYEMVVDVYETDDSDKALTEEKFIELIEKMIDTIEFLDQSSNV